MLYRREAKVKLMVLLLLLLLQIARVCLSAANHVIEMKNGIRGHLTTKVLVPLDPNESFGNHR